MTSVKNFYVSKSVKKTETTCGKVFLYQQTVLLKMIMYMTLGFTFLLYLNGSFFYFKKTSFRCCGYSNAISTFLGDCGQKCLYQKDG